MHSHIYTDINSVQPLINELKNDKPLPTLSTFVDGRGLSCPMPLLKAKIALRDITIGTIYVVATDQNSATDIAAFCQKNTLSLEHWQSNDSTATIFHFLITKNSSN